MPLTGKINVLKSLEYDGLVKHGLGYKQQECITGIFSTFTHSWLAYGAQLFIISHTDGTTRCSWTFGEYCNEEVEITCVIELPLEGCTIPLLIVGVSSENVNQISFFNPNTRKIIRTIDLIYPVRAMCIVEHGLHEVSPVNDTLTNTQGLIAAGCADGSLLLLDLCRSILLKALSCDFRYVSNEEKPVEICCLDLKSVSSSVVQETLQECYNSNNNFAILLSDEIKGITALYYSFESAILYFGTSLGSFVLWNMSSLTVLYRSSSIGRAITSLSLLEPCDDPRHNLFLWVCFEQHPYVCMYCITFKSKYYVEGYGVYYQGFVEASPYYKLRLCEEENLVTTSAISSQAISKSVSKNLAKSFSIPESEVSELRLFITGYEVLYKGTATKNIVIFDLNQWYKEQMPDEGISNCVDIVDLGDSAFLYFNIDPSSVSHYQWMRPLEQHFYPSSLDFKIWCIEEGGIRCLEKLGLQSQWIKNMKAIGPSALLTPTQVYQGALSAGLLSMFIEPPDPDLTTIEEARTYVLTVCLENRVTSVIENCAEEWSAGSHPVAGCTLGFLIEWLWKLQAAYKSCANRMCVPLFDQSGLRFDFSEQQSLQHCKSLLSTVQTVYEVIVSKYKSYVLVDGINQKLTAMSLVKFYFDCCLKLISANLLPEPNEAGRPNDSIAYKYDEIREFAISKRKNGPLLADSLIGKTGGESQWEEEGGLACYPPPSIQSVLRYCLHPGPPLTNKYSLLLYLYMDIINSHEPLRLEGGLEKVKNFQYLLRIPDIQYKIVSSFWFLDHSLFDEGITLILDPKVLSMDLTDDQHRNILTLLLLQKQEKLGLQYLRLKAPPLHTPSDISLEMKLLLGNRLINEAFMFQRRHPKLREELLLQFFQGCIEKKLLGPVFGLHLDPKEESVLFKFLKSSDLKEKGDLQVLLLLSNAKYNEAISLNDRLNSTVNGPKARLETDTRDMIVRGITGSLSTISRDMATEMRKYRPPPPGTRPAPLSSLIKIRIEPDGPLCQSDSHILLSAAARCTRHLSEFISMGNSKRKHRSFEDEDEAMDIDVIQPPRKKAGLSSAENDIRHYMMPAGVSYTSGTFRSIRNKEREVLDLVGIPLVKKRGKRYSPLSRPSPSILKGKSVEKGFVDEQGETPKKSLRFNLPDNEKKVIAKKSLYNEYPTIDNTSAADLSMAETMREKVKSSRNNVLLSDGRVDWDSVAKPEVRFTPGVGGKKSFPVSTKAKTYFLDITITDAERKYLDSPSKDYDLSQDTETLLQDLTSRDSDEEIQNEIDKIKNKYLSQESFLDRYKRLRNKHSFVKQEINKAIETTCDQSVSPKVDNTNENEIQTTPTVLVDENMDVTINSDKIIDSNIKDDVNNDENKQNENRETIDNVKDDETENAAESAETQEEDSSNIKVLSVFSMEQFDEENTDVPQDKEESPQEISSDEEVEEEPPKDKMSDVGEQSEDVASHHSSWEDMSEDEKYSYQGEMAELFDEADMEDEVSSEALQSEDSDDSSNYLTDKWVKKSNEDKKKSPVIANNTDSVICLDSDSEDSKQKICNWNVESNDSNPFDEEDYSQPSTSERSGEEYLDFSKLSPRRVQSESDNEDTEDESRSQETVPIKSSKTGSSFGEFEMSDVDNDPTTSMDPKGIECPITDLNTYDADATEETETQASDRAVEKIYAMLTEPPKSGENEEESNIGDNNEKTTDVIKDNIEGYEKKQSKKVDDCHYKSASTVKTIEDNEQNVAGPSHGKLPSNDEQTIAEEIAASPAGTSVEENDTREHGGAAVPLDVETEEDSESSGDNNLIPSIGDYDPNELFDNPFPVPLNVASKYRQKCEKVQRDDCSTEEKQTTNDRSDIFFTNTNPFEIDNIETIEVDEVATGSVNLDTAKVQVENREGSQQDIEDNKEHSVDDKFVEQEEMSKDNPTIKEDSDLKLISGPVLNVSSQTEKSRVKGGVSLEKSVTLDLVKEEVTQTNIIDVSKAESAANITSSIKISVEESKSVALDLVEKVVCSTDMDVVEPKEETRERPRSIMDLVNACGEQCFRTSKEFALEYVSKLVQPADIDLAELEEENLESSDTDVITCNRMCVEDSKSVTLDLVKEEVTQTNNIDVSKAESAANITSSIKISVEESKSVALDVVEKVVWSTDMDVVEPKEETIERPRSIMDIVNACGEQCVRTSKELALEYVAKLVQPADIDLAELEEENLESSDTDVITCNQMCVEDSKSVTPDLVGEVVRTDVKEPKDENFESTTDIITSNEKFLEDSKCITGEKSLGHILETQSDDFKDDKNNINVLKEISPNEESPNLTGRACLEVDTKATVNDGLKETSISNEHIIIRDCIISEGVTVEEKKVKQGGESYSVSKRLDDNFSPTNKIEDKTNDKYEIQPLKDTSVKTFFFGKDTNSDSYIRASKATFQVGNLSSTSIPAVEDPEKPMELGEGEPEKPMETAIIDEGSDNPMETAIIDEGSDNPMETAMIVEESEITIDEDEIDPRNMGMLDVDLGLHLSEDEREVKENKPETSDKGVSTTDSYLLRKARRSSRNMETGETKMQPSTSGYPQIVSKEVGIQQQDTANNPESDLGQFKDGKSSKSFSTQTSESCFDVLNKDTNYSEVKDPKTKDIKLIKTRRASAASQTSESKTSEEPNRLNLEDSLIGSTRGRRQRRGSSSSQTSDVQLPEVQQIENTKSNVLEERIRFSSHSKDPHDIQKNVSEKKSRSSVQSQSSEGTRKKDDITDGSKTSKDELSEKGIRGILKKSSTRESTDNFTDELLSQKKLSRRSSSHSSVVEIPSDTKKAGRKSQEPVLRGILKNSRSSVTSETSIELRKRLEEDFPEERKYSRRSYSEEPEYQNICKRTGAGYNSKSQKYLTVNELQTRFEDHYRDKSRQKKHSVEGETYESKRDNEEKRSSRKLSEDRELPRTHKKTERQSSHLPETSSDHLSHKEYTESRRTRRQSVDSEISSNSDKLMIQHGKSRRHSQAPDDKEIDSRINIRRQSVDREHPSSLDNIAHRGKSRRYSHTSDDTEVDSRGNTRRRSSVDRENLGNSDKTAYRGKSRRQSHTSDDREVDFRASNEDVSMNRMLSRKSLLLSRYKEDYSYEDQQVVDKLSVCSDNHPYTPQDYADGSEKSYSSEPGSSKSRTRQRRSSTADIFENVQPKKRRISQSSEDALLKEEPKAVGIRRSSRKSVSEDSLENSNLSSRSPSEESTPRKKRKHVNNPLNIYNIEEEAPKVSRKTRSLNDVPIRKSTRLLRPILEDIKEEDEETPRKNRSLDDLDADKIKLKTNKKPGRKTFLPMVIAESDSDADTNSPIGPFEEYTKERRLTRTQKRMLLKNQQIIEHATPSPTKTTPKKQSRNTTPVVVDSPLRTPTRSSLRLQKKPPSETD